MDEFLDQPIATSPLSEEFRITMEILGFITFRDLAARRSPELLRLPGFTREFLYQYVNYMEMAGYGRLIDP